MTNYYLYFLKYLDWWSQKWIYIFSLLFAVFSGFVAFYLSLPLPWMLGPLIGCGLLSAFGKKIIIGKKPRPILLFSGRLRPTMNSELGSINLLRNLPL